MANLIDGNTTYIGTTGYWKRGMSAYQEWLADGNVGSRHDFLESLKAFSPVFSAPVVDGDTVTFTMTDEDGTYEITLHSTPSIIGSTEYEGRTEIHYSDGTNVSIYGVPGPQGEKGDKGTKVEFMTTAEGVVFWKYVEDDSNWKEIIDINEVAKEQVRSEMSRSLSYVYVYELPDPSVAVPNVEYRLITD